MYIDINYDRKKDKILISEYHNGVTLSQEYNPVLFFYIEDPKGKYESISGTKLAKLEFKNYKSFMGAVRRYRSQGVQTYEADIRPTFKTLERHFFGKPSKVNLNKTYFDIEVKYDKERGYAPPSDPFNPITAISLYNDWEGTLYSMSLPPDGMTMEEAERQLEGIPNNIICETEQQMFSIFFELIKDTNVFSGWNSSFFDIPYMVNRSKRIMGTDAPKHFCLWDKTPSSRMVEKYGKEQETFDLIGKVHLDMMELYQKYTYTEQQSYRLDYIAQIEIGEEKTVYEGTLDQLYNNDYRKFMIYSRQDTQLLKKLDDKLRHIELAFTIAYENGVDVKTVMGAVALSDNALVLEAHRRNLIVPDRKRSTSSEERIAGAWVADPEKGLHEWIGSVDLSSLYPSVFRALNLGNETIIGQIEHTITGPIIQARLDKGLTFAEAWHGIFWVDEVDRVLEQSTETLRLSIDGDQTYDMTGKEIYDFVFDNDFIITANGTIIRTDKQSILSSLLERWFNERTAFKNKSHAYTLLSSDGIALTEDLLAKIQKLI